MSEMNKPVTDNDEVDLEVNGAAIRLNALKKEQKPLLGISAGIAATIVSTGLWMLLAQKYQMSWMAIGAAFGIAFAIQYAGKTVDTWYGIVGALLSLIASLVGNTFTAVTMLSKHGGKTVAEILTQLDISTTVSLLKALMRPFDYLLFIGAIVAAYWFSFKHIPSGSKQ